MQSATRVEAERLLGISEKLLQNRDLMGSREFAILAQETEPLLEGSDQILAIVEVLLAADKRVNNHPDWYAVLQVDRRSDDLDLIKKQYRRLALLLHPDKSRFPFADHAFKLVADAWALLSDPLRKSVYDKELSFFSRVDFAAARDEIHADENSRRRNSTFWTACPYCYRLYEYPRVYEACCLRCQNCERSFHGVPIPSLPPLVPGQDAYYCCWGFFPMGFVLGSFGSPEKEAAAEPPPPPPPATQPASTLPNWMPVVSANGGESAQATPVPVARVTRSGAAAVAGGVSNGTGPKKRGRPRKYPLPS
uniref:DnaJ isogeny subfamily B member 12 n=1 Tax=Cajanus cajan TaxID=3821 RepID=A0A151RXG3_CAJCA|nr:DnaJ isogeny subfamily B member 12 [Cajanus cajan]